MEADDHIDLNDYHRQQSERLVKEISEQPLLSPEESMKQLQKLITRSQKPVTSAGN